MTFFVVDVESDGPAPVLYSMVSFGAVRVDDALDKTFFGQTGPITENWDPESLAISRVTREEHLGYENPAIVMRRFAAWLAENSDGPPVFISDNPAYDWQFINYYLHAYTGSNPFGYSARRIGDVYGGILRDLNAGSKWRELIKTKATHDPVEDAMGNAEAFLALIKQYDLLGERPPLQTDLLLARAAGFDFVSIQENPPPHQSRLLLRFAELVRQELLTKLPDADALQMENMRLKVCMISAAKRLCSSEDKTNIPDLLRKAVYWNKDSA
jgi:hypothetical protein